MSSKNKTAGALAAFAVVALMAGPAIAGKPMNVVEKKQAADAKLAQMALVQAQPVSATDGDAIQVPDELHNYLHAEVDAKGKVRIIETDGPTAPAKTVELTK